MRDAPHSVANNRSRGIAMGANVHHIADHHTRSPQVENGYIRIANELNQAICRAHLSGNEMAVAFAIVAKTYGYNKKTDDMSASQIGDYCDIARNHVTEVLKSLEARNIITKRPGKYGSIIGIQKDYSLWLAKEKRKEQAASPSYGLADEVVRNSDADSPKLGQVDSPKDGHTKDNLPKDNQQKTKTLPTSQATPPAALPSITLPDGKKLMAQKGDAPGFLQIWAVYPDHNERKPAAAYFAGMKADAAKVDVILAAIEVHKRSDQWQQGFIPRLKKFLKDERYNDEVQVAYAADEIEVIDAYNVALGDQYGRVDPGLYTKGRALAIRAFRQFPAKKPQHWNVYFPYIATNCEMPPRTGFDYLIKPETYDKMRSGQHDKKQ